jgi:hypothetical protein
MVEVQGPFLIETAGDIRILLLNGGGTSREGNGQQNGD